MLRVGAPLPPGVGQRLGQVPLLLLEVTGPVPRPDRIENDDRGVVRHRVDQRPIVSQPGKP